MKLLKLDTMKYALSTSLIALLVFAGCERSVTGLSEPTASNNPEVFVDGFSAGLEYFPYDDGFAKLDAFQVDTEVTFGESEASMRIDVPNPGDPTGVYAGASFIDLNGGRDLTEYDALTFYARATKSSMVNQIGFGQGENNANFEVQIDSLQLATYWQKFIIPIPNPSKLTQESGLFWFAEDPENGEGYSFWIDELQFETLGNLAQPRPFINNGEDTQIISFVNLTNNITGFSHTVNTVILLPDETTTTRDVTVSTTANYFDFISSNSSVATVSESGVITVVGEGVTTISATLDGTSATGSIEITSNGVFNSAPIPTQDPDSVISIFSDAYTNIAVDYYNGFFVPDGQTTQGGTGFVGGPPGADIVVNGDGIINYTELNFVGIGTFLNVPSVDATNMTHFSIDINVQEEVEPGDYITLQLLNDVGGNESSGSYRIPADSLIQNDWASFDIPLSEFGLVDRSSLGLIFLISDNTISNVYVDNIYYYKDGTPDVFMPPTVDITGAPTPTVNSDSVISVFSDAYTNVDVDYYNGFFTPDGQTTLGGTGFDGGPRGADFLIESNLTDGIINYTELNFVGIGTFLEVDPIDASNMTTLHVDIYVNEPVDPADFIRLQLLNQVQGANETSGSVTISSSNLQEGGWVSLDIPLQNFGLADRSELGLLFFITDDTISDIYVDNIYYYNNGSPVVSGPPTVDIDPAPTPTADANDVISIFSDTYTNVNVDYYNGFFEFSTTQGGTGFDGGPPGADFLIASDTSNGIINYTSLNFVGIGTFDQVSTVDASSMTHLHADIYVNEPLDATDYIDFRIINSVGNNESGGVLVRVPAANLTQGEWTSIDIPLIDFALPAYDQLGLIFFISDDTISDIYVDNVYYYDDGSSIVQPQLPVTFDDNNVTYSVSTFNGTTFEIVANPDESGSNATASDVGSITNSGQSFEGIAFNLGSAVDLNSSNTITMDVWSDQAVPVLFKFEAGVGGGADTEIAVNHTGSGWEELTFTFGATSSHMRIVLFIDGPGTTTGTFYIDNIEQQ